MKYVLLTPKPWHDPLFKHLQQRSGEEWIRITEKEDFTADRLRDLQPDRIFIPHWSHIIKNDIYDHFECIVFHMTDLPYGRGGSPLQNLIVEGKQETKVTAIRVAEGIDTGDVYHKEALSLDGTALEIFQRSSKVIQRMIEYIISNAPEPVPQTGDPYTFKRRKPQDSDLAPLTELSAVYDYIRMLDCEGYPKAFLETDHFRIEFDNASIDSDESVKAHVRITKK